MVLTSPPNFLGELDYYDPRVQLSHQGLIEADSNRKPRAGRRERRADGGQCPRIRNWQTKKL
jgi:hypothetical protein